MVDNVCNTDQALIPDSALPAEKAPREEKPILLSLNPTLLAAFALGVRLLVGGAHQFNTKTTEKPLNTKQITEEEMREALGLAPSKPAPEKPKHQSTFILVELSVRKPSGGPAFRYEHKSRSLSTLEARLEAEKAVRKKGLEVWAVLDVRQVSG